MVSDTTLLEARLRFRVHQDKSAVADVRERARPPSESGRLPDWPSLTRMKDRLAHHHDRHVPKGKRRTRMAGPVLAVPGKGSWRLAGSPQAAYNMPNAWFVRAGLVNLALHYAALNSPGNRRDMK